MAHHTLAADAVGIAVYEAYAALKAGDTLDQNGYTYRATLDPEFSEAHGYDRVFVQAVRNNPAMPSGWELADLMASWKQRAGAAA